MARRGLYWGQKPAGPLRAGAPLLALSGLSGLRWVGFYPLFHIAELARRADVWAGLGALVIALGLGWLAAEKLREAWS